MNKRIRYRGIIAVAIPVVLSIAGIWSCKKKDSGAFTYNASTLHDTSIEQGKNGVLYFTINKLTGAGQYVTDSVSDTHAGIHATIAPNRALAPYISAIGFMVAEDAAPSTYEYTVTTATDGQEDQTYTTHITVLDCIQARAGSYTVTSSCDTINHTSLVSPYPNSFHRISISNFANAGYTPAATVYADVYCTNNSLTIPSQLFTKNGQTYTITGTGTSDDKQMVITYTLTQGGAPVPGFDGCQEHYTRP